MYVPPGVNIITPCFFVRMLVGALLAACTLAHAEPRLSALSDAPDPAFQRPAPAHARAPAGYAEALLQWKSADDINAWLGGSFVYDSARALALSETARAAGSSSAVLEPASFFAQPRGVCVDMARFAVSALREIEPRSEPAYLMIEFAPVRIAGQVLRLHWLATFQRDGKHYFFADSRRPGHMAGPYDSVDSFVAEYGAYRDRPVVAHKVLQGYERRVRKRAPAAGRADSAPGQR